MNGASAVLKNGGFGTPVALHGQDGGAFLGLEYPAGTNTAEPDPTGATRIVSGVEVGERETDVRVALAASGLTQQRCRSPRSRTEIEDLRRLCGFEEIDESPRRTIVDLRVSKAEGERFKDPLAHESREPGLVGELEEVEPRDLHTASAFLRT